MRNQPLHIPSLTAILLSMSGIGLLSPLAAQTLRVSTYGADTNSGLTWGSALRTVQAALARATSDPTITRIEVAAGTYKPGGSRSDTFSLVSGLTIAGGYPATGGSVADPDLHETILSGEIGVAEDPFDNSYSVVLAHDVHGVRLEGLRIRGGAAFNLAAWPWGRGGGIYAENSSLLVSKCRFRANLAINGGAVSLASCAATFEDCQFVSNHGAWGGAITCEFVQAPCDVLIDRCRFFGNGAGAAGAIGNRSCELAIYNSVFSGNMAYHNSGGAVNSEGETHITRLINSSFANNVAGWGSAYFATGTGLSEIVNSIFWNSPGTVTGSPIGMMGYGSVHHCVVQGLASAGLAGWSNVDVDPQFVDPLGSDGLVGTADDDLHVQRLSPCVNAGDNAAVTTFAGLDIDRTARVQRPTPRGAAIVDIGADEIAPLGL